jgi:hypothetical protein
MNMTRTVLLVSLLLTVPLAADVRFFIERIEVRNTRRVSPELVISESLLREGRDYSEAELRDASARLTRLPYLLTADFALEKGSERGRHVLVLTVTETRPFFFLVDAQPIFERNDDFLDVDNNSRVTNGDTLAFGFRWFVGRRGAFHAGFAANGEEREFTSDYAAFSVGYTQYDLFGTRAFATLNLKRPIEGYGEGQISPQVVIGMPLTTAQTVTVQYDETRFERDGRIVSGLPVQSDYAERRISARWSYNTTNDPFLPTRGTQLQVTPAITKTDGATTVTDQDGRPVSLGSHGTVLSIAAGASHNWEVTDRNSVFGDLRGSWERIDQSLGGSHLYDRDARYGSIAVGATHSFWTSEERARGGDMRLELQLRYSNRTLPEVLGPPRRIPGRDVRQIGLAWIRRSSWGTARLGAGWAW